MAEDEAAEVETVNEGGSGYALITDAWPTMVKVSIVNTIPKILVIFKLER